jgi:hypothetical protein
VRGVPTKPFFRRTLEVLETDPSIEADADAEDEIACMLEHGFKAEIEAVPSLINYITTKIDSQSWIC